MDYRKLRDIDLWKTYLGIVPTVSNYDVLSQVDVVASFPTATVLADTTRWQKKGRKIKAGSKPIRLKKGGKTFYLFDVSQTTGEDNGKTVWTYNRNCDRTLVVYSCKEYNIPYRPDYSFEEMLSVVLNNLPVKARNLEQARFIRRSVAYSVFKRLGLEDTQIYDFSYISELSDTDLYYTIGIVSEAAHNYLSLVRDVQAHLDTYTAEIKDEYIKSAAEKDEIEAIEEVSEETSLSNDVEESETLSEEKAEKPTLSVGDMIEYNNKTWLVTDVGFVMQFENVDSNDESPFFSFVGGLDYFMETHDYKLVENKKRLTATSDNITVDEHTGTWYVIDNDIINGEEVFLLESEQYGDEAACLVVNSSGKLLLDDVYNGLEDYKEHLELSQSSTLQPQADSEPKIVEQIVNPYDMENKILCKHGTMFVGGKFRIYNIIKTCNRKDRANKIRDEFGIGGTYNSDYELDSGAKGLTFTIGNKAKHYPWSAVADRLAELVDNGSYITVDEATDYISKNSNDIFADHTIELSVANEILLNAEADWYIDIKHNITELTADADDERKLTEIEGAIKCARQGKVDSGFFLWNGINSYLSSLDKASAPALCELVSDFTQTDSMKDVSDIKARCDKALSEIKSLKENVNTIRRAEPSQTVTAPDIRYSEAPKIIDITNRNYDKAAKLFPGIFDGTHTYEKYEVPRVSCYETLIAEKHDDILLLYHYYMQNGDMMYDPSIEYQIDSEEHKLIPLSFEQSSIAYYEEATTEAQRSDLSSFTSQWLNNISHQGYMLTSAVDSITGELTRYYDEDEAQEIFAEMYEPVETEEDITQTSGTDTLHVGEIVKLSDRTYTVTNIDEDKETAELRDDNTGWYPIFHSERIADINSAKEQTKATDKLVEALRPTPKLDYTITDMELGVDKPREKYRKNVEAIKLLKKLESENRLATAEEQEVLAQYVGWGGLSDAFDESKWADEYTELKALLSEEEYSSAVESTTTAFYTQPIIIDKMYEVLESLGFKGGKVLEPAMAVGNFFGRMPEEIRNNSKCYGIELDSISGRIAKQLYQNANIQVCGYEQSQLPDDYFDVAISNVPFGDFKVDDKRYNKLNMRIHDYYFAKTIDKVHSGGVIAFITSKGTLDKVNAKVREYISERCELIGAIRLPETAFKANAGTEAVSDIIFLQKRDEITSKLDKSWVYTGQYIAPSYRKHNLNQYYINNPEMICGTLEETSTRFGFDTTCVLDVTSLEDALSFCVDKLKGKVQFRQNIIEINPGEQLSVDEGQTQLDAPADMPNGSYRVIDNVIYYREGAKLTPQDFKSNNQKVIDALNIHDTARDIIDCQYNGITDSMLAIKQQYLNEIYDEFVAKYKTHLDNLKVSCPTLDSNFISFIESLEVTTTNPDKSISYEKAPVFSQRTIRQRFEITHCDTIQDAFTVCMQNKARIDFDYISSLCDNVGREDIINSLIGDKIFRIPNTDDYVTADEYLSGNVRKKLKTAQLAARSDEQYGINVKALEAVQPQWLYSNEISVQLGSSWVPTRTIEDFIEECMGFYYASGVKVQHFEATATWNITNKAYASLEYTPAKNLGTKRMNFLHILEHILNQQDIKIRDKLIDSNGNEKFVLNKKDTAEAIAKADAIKEKFAGWIWRNPKRKEDLERIYNENINNEVVRTYDGSGLNFDGMSSLIELKPHQKNVVARAIYSGNTLIAHTVGAGKTYEMTAIAMELKRVGIANKSLFAVPNHLLSQWAADFTRLYPNANILVATKEDFKKENRKRFVSRIATGNYDAVIIGHSTFGMLQVSKERRERFYDRMIDECEEIIRSGSKKDLSVKEAVRIKKMYQAKLKALEFEKVENVIDFEKLGCDALFIDEAHLFKNLATTTRLGRIGGISTAASKRSEDLLLKTMYLSEINGGNKGVIFATGTPISNSLVEMFTMQRYLQPDFLKERGLQAFDAWAADFVNIETVIELDPTGTGFRAKKRCSSFNNVPELMTHFRRCTDIQTAEMLKLPVPKLKDGKYTVCVIKPSEEQQEFIANCGDRAEEIKNHKTDPRVDNYLKITHDGKMCAIDMRLVDPDAEDRPDSKINIAIENIAKKYEETDKDKLTQIVFLDVSTPSSEFNLYDDIRNKLVNNYGIPREEIAFIHEAKNDEEKLKLFDRVNSGNCRIIIGSTAKLGAGTNIQNRLCALHHLDVAWKPSDIEQREGRILRQGNINEEVEIFRYVTEKSFDAYSWQLIENKQKIISQVMTDKVCGRSVDDVDEQALNYAEIKMLATGNTKIKEHLDLKISVQRLQLQRSQFLDEQSQARRNLETRIPKQLESQQTMLANLEEAQEYAKQFPKGSDIDDETITAQDETPFSIVIEGVTYDNRKDGGQAILNATAAYLGANIKYIGTYRGFEVGVFTDTLVQAHLILKAKKIQLDTSLGMSGKGNLTRLDNLIDTRLPEKVELQKQQIADTNNLKEFSENLVKQSFPKEQEYQEKNKRLTELTRELSFNDNSESTNIAVYADDLEQGESAGKGR